MKDNFESALVIGSCILIGCGVIGAALCSPKDIGPLAVLLAIIFGSVFLYQSWKHSDKE